MKFLDRTLLLTIILKYNVECTIIIYTEMYFETLAKLYYICFDILAL